MRQAGLQPSPYATTSAGGLGGTFVGLGADAGGAGGAAAAGFAGGIAGGMGATGASHRSHASLAHASHEELLGRLHACEAELGRAEAARDAAAEALRGEARAGEDARAYVAVLEKALTQRSVGEAGLPADAARLQAELLHARSQVDVLTRELREREGRSAGVIRGLEVQVRELRGSEEALRRQLQRATRSSVGVPPFGATSAGFVAGFTAAGSAGGVDEVGYGAAFGRADGGFASPGRPAYGDAAASGGAAAGGASGPVHAPSGGDVRIFSPRLAREISRTSHQQQGHAGGHDPRRRGSAGSAGRGGRSHSLSPPPVGASGHGRRRSSLDSVSPGDRRRAASAAAGGAGDRRGHERGHARDHERDGRDRRRDVDVDAGADRHGRGDGGGPGGSASFDASAAAAALATAKDAASLAEGSSGTVASLREALRLREGELQVRGAERGSKDRGSGSGRGRSRMGKRQFHRAFWSLDTSAAACEASLMLPYHHTASARFFLLHSHARTVAPPLYRPRLVHLTCR
jgi:hypothetical protein